MLEKHSVKVIGVQVDAIERGEDRIAFKETMNKLGIDMPKSEPATSVEEAEKIATKMGYPVVVRPAYTMGGTGGGIVYNLEELRLIASRGISASLIGQILIEESVIGWEELELEVVRDAKNQMITTTPLTPMIRINTTCNTSKPGAKAGQSTAAIKPFAIGRPCAISS